MDRYKRTHTQGLVLQIKQQQHLSQMMYQLVTGEYSLQDNLSYL